MDANEKEMLVDTKPKEKATLSYVICEEYKINKSRDY